MRKYRPTGRKIHIWILAVLTLVILLPFLPSLTDSFKARCMQVPILDQAAFDGMTKDLEKIPFSGSDLLWNGLEVPFYADAETIYLPQNLEEDGFRGRLTGNADTDLYFLKDDLFADKKSAIASNHPFRLLLVQEHSYSEVSLVFTGLPAIVIHGDTIPEPEDRTPYSGSFTILDPGEKAKGHLSASLFCSYNIRGASTASLPKSSYRIHLLDQDGSAKDQMLLGMRMDNDWILNAQYTETSRIRERLCYQLWNDITALEAQPSYGSQMEYVELYINDKYRGLYGLMVPTDQKRTKLAKGDLLYKVTDTISPEDIAAAKGLAIPNPFNGRNRAEVKYPRRSIAEKMGHGALWNPLQTYRSFAVGDIRYEQALSLGVTPDIDSILDFNWFLMLTQSVDNNWTNMFITARGQEDGTYRMYETIWDMNVSFGDVYDEQDALFQTFKPESATDFSRSYYTPIDDAFRALCQQKPEEMRARSRAKLDSWAAAGLNADYVNGLAASYMETLTASGAMAREAAKWPEIQVSADITALQAWISARFETVYANFDSYMDFVCGK